MKFIKVYIEFDEEYNEKQLFKCKGLTVEGKLIPISIEEYQKNNPNWRRER